MKSYNEKDENEKGNEKMKFPKEILLESVALRNNDRKYGLEFVQELGNDDAGCSEMVVVIFKHEGKFYSFDIQRINGELNYHSWDDEVECPQVIRKEAIQYYWEEVK